MSPTPTIRAVATPVELISIQYLRAVAALGVVVWHAQGQVGLANTTVLQAGIEVFFVISGFVMWLILDQRPVSALTFLRKRFTRVVPLYWLLTTVMVILLLAAPQLLQSTRFDVVHVLTSYLFIAWPNPVEGVGLKPVMIPGWTLNYEIAFYVLLAIGLTMKAAWRDGFVIGILLALSVAAWLPLPPVLAFYASPFMAEIALGMGLAMAMKRWPRAFSHGGWMVAAGGLLLMLGASRIDAQAHDRLIWFALPVTLMVAGVIGLERAGRLPVVPGLKAIGDASYPLYMIHPVLLSAMAQGWRAMGLSALSPWLYVALALVVTSGVGWLAHVTLERPLIAVFKPRSRPGRHSPALVPAAAEDIRP